MMLLIKSYLRQKIAQSIHLYSLFAIAEKVVHQEAVSSELDVPLDCMYCSYGLSRQKELYWQGAPTTEKEISTRHGKITRSKLTTLPKFHISVLYVHVASKRTSGAQKGKG